MKLGDILKNFCIINIIDTSFCCQESRREYSLRRLVLKSHSAEPRDLIVKSFIWKIERGSAVRRNICFHREKFDGISNYLN